VHLHYADLAAAEAALKTAGFGEVTLHLPEGEGDRRQLVRIVEAK